MDVAGGLECITQNQIKQSSIHFLPPFSANWKMTRKNISSGRFCVDRGI